MSKNSLDYESILKISFDLEKELHILTTDQIKSCMKQAVMQACKEIEKEQREWISVGDRLPDIGWNEYLCLSEEGYMMVQKYRGGHWTDDFRDSGSITHWMPLPEPPKED